MYAKLQAKDRMSDSEHPRLEKFGAMLFDRSPKLLAIITFLVGAFALISAAIPNGPIKTHQPIERLIAETPVLALTIGGLALMFLSLGLRNSIFPPASCRIRDVSHSVSYFDYGEKKLFPPF